MFRFLFGLVWTLIMTPIVIICIFIPAEQRNGVEMNPLILSLLALFEIIGLYLMYVGLKEIIKNLKTKKLGTQCYGIIRNIQQTGATLNDRPELKATVEIINPETHQLETIEETIGFDENKYPINSYVLCKYYNKDINLEKVVAENEVPIDITYRLSPVNQPTSVTDIVFSDDREYVTIDGVKYKKVKD